MPTGVSPIQYPEQPSLPDTMMVELDNSYFLVKLYDAQAFFEAGWLVRPGILTISSSVESSFQAKSPPLQSLHQITTLQKNIPCRLGLSVNLTDWLPARTTDWLRITLNYTLVQDTPVRDLVEKMGKIGLASTVSLVSADLTVAVKVSEIVGRLLSYLMGEGSQHSLFSLQMDLNLSDLQSGYYAVIGSLGNEDWPATLKIDSQGRLTDKRDHLLTRHSYAVIQVLGRKRRGNEIARGQTWWELLEMSRELALSTDQTNIQERNSALSNWRRTLILVRKYAYEEHGYLLKEIEDIIRERHLEVQQYLLPETGQEALGDEELPAEWQDLLGVQTERELWNSVRDYKEAVRISQQLLQQYERQSQGD